MKTNNLTGEYTSSELEELLKGSNFKREDYNFEADENFSLRGNEEITFDNSNWSILELGTCWDSEFNGKPRKIISQFAWVILKDGDIKYVVSIYEPHGYLLNENRGCITFYGHEEIKTLWLDNGEVNSHYTR